MSAVGSRRAGVQWKTAFRQVVLTVGLGIWPLAIASAFVDPVVMTLGTVPLVFALSPVVRWLDGDA